MTFSLPDPDPRLACVAILLLAGLASWAKIARGPPAARRRQRARRCWPRSFPITRSVAVWIAGGQVRAVARSGDQALILYRSGDGHVARQMRLERGWRRRGRQGGVVRFGCGDVAAPRARSPWPRAAWPPWRRAGVKIDPSPWRRRSSSSR